MKNRKIWFLLIFIFILNFNLFLAFSSASSSITVEWSRTWGGSGGENGRGIALDSSNNIYIGGITTSFGEGKHDMCLVKYDKFGIQQWDHIWCGNDSDECNAIALDSSDNIYITGWTCSFGEGKYDMCLVKFNSSGVQQWNTTWGGNNYDWGRALTIDSSDNIYIAGYTESFGTGCSDIFLVKYDSSGVQQWNTTWGGNDDDIANGVAIDSLNNVYIAGCTESFVPISSDICLVKYDSSGVQQWNRTWGGSNLDVGFGIVIDSSDNIYISGWTRSFGAGRFDMCIVKFSSSGVIHWNKSWGGCHAIQGNAIALDTSDNVYVSGSTGSFGGKKNDIYLMKCSGSGLKLWNNTWDGGYDDFSYAITLDSSDNIYLSGSTRSSGTGDYDMLLIKIPKTSEISIPGYDFLIFLSVIGVVSIILINKYYKFDK